MENPADDPAPAAAVAAAHLAPPLPPAREEDFDLWLEAGRTEKHYWLDLWRYRELFQILAWRDIAVRYKQTVAGAGWAILQPFLSMLIMTFIFSRLAGLPSEGGAPYAIMVFAGMLPWQFFATSLSTSSLSIVGNANLISKVYFPRIIIPASAVVVAVVDLLISFSILGGLLAWHRFAPSWHLVALPLLVLFAFIAALGPGLILTALTVKYRDFRFVTPFLIQFGMYATPVAYSSSIVRQKLGEGIYLLYCLNPVAGVVDAFRWAILGTPLPTAGLSVSAATATLLFALGIWNFRRTEKAFADII